MVDPHQLTKILTKVSTECSKILQQVMMPLECHSVRLIQKSLTSDQFSVELETVEYYGKNIWLQVFIWLIDSFLTYGGPGHEFLNNIYCSHYVICILKE